MSMKSLTKPTWTMCYLVAGIISLIFITGAMKAHAEDGDMDPGQAVEPVPITLESAILLDSKPTIIEFKITNNSEKVYTTTPIMMHSNVLYVTAPDGEVIRVDMQAEDTKYIYIEAKNTYTWRVNISESLLNFVIIDPGIYRICWVVYDLEVNAINGLKLNILKSNELRIVKQAAE